MTALGLVILAGAIAVSVAGCEQNHYDMYLGTDAGEGFDAPARETGVDGGADAGDAGDASDDGSTSDDGSPSEDGSASD